MKDQLIHPSSNCDLVPITQQIGKTNELLAAPFFIHTLTSHKAMGLPCRRSNVEEIVAVYSDKEFPKGLRYCARTRIRLVQRPVRRRLAFGSRALDNCYFVANMAYSRAAFLTTPPHGFRRHRFVISRFESSRPTRGKLYLEYR